MYPTTKDFNPSVPVVIPNGAALSDAIDVRRYPNACYILNGNWTAASLGFQVSLDGVNFYPLRNAAGTLIEYTLTTTPSEGRALPAEIAAFQYVKLWSETGGVGVNQGAARTFVVGTKV
jgi:hypothetical protein